MRQILTINLLRQVLQSCGPDTSSTTHTGILLRSQKRRVFFNWNTNVTGQPFDISGEKLIRPQKLSLKCWLMPTNTKPSCNPTTPTLTTQHIFWKSWPFNLSPSCIYFCFHISNRSHGHLLHVLYVLTTSEWCFITFCWFFWCYTHYALYTMHCFHNVSKKNFL